MSKKPKRKRGSKRPKKARVEEQRRIRKGAKRKRRRERLARRREAARRKIAYIDQQIGLADWAVELAQIAVEYARRWTNDEYETIAQDNRYNDSVWQEFKKLQKEYEAKLNRLRQQAQSEQRKETTLLIKAQKAYRDHRRPHASQYSVKAHRHAEKVAAAWKEIRKINEELGVARRKAEKQGVAIDRTGFEEAHAVLMANKAMLKRARRVRGRLNREKRLALKELREPCDGQRTIQREQRRAA